jgi:demethylspheroidene O-methyltransferase
LTALPPLTAAPRLSLAARAGLSPAFHALCARIPGLRHIARAEGRAIFDEIQGFVRSQVLMALVETGILDRLSDRPLTLAEAARTGVLPDARARVLMRAGAGIGLLAERRGLWHLTARGAAFLAVPGLAAMVRHHGALYRDLADPVAFFRGGGETELARFWPYVFGAGAAEDPGRADRYSRLMADSQALVAEDTLRMVDLRGVGHLMDVGGGTGAFLAAVGSAYPDLRLTLFDLPAVVAPAESRFRAAGRDVTIVPGSFRDDPLPPAGAISLVRVLYDHADATVAALLAAVCRALPPGGRLIVSEPMAGASAPDPATDVYFAVYTLAMGTGRTRRPQEIAELARAAGFCDLRISEGFRPFVTSVVEARKPS